MRIAYKISQACALALSLAAGATARAQVPDPTRPPGQDAGREIVVEKTVYVPFEKLEAVFEKEGRGIFLPYEEFLKLWQAGQPKPVDIKPDDPPAAAVVRGGLYAGSVLGETARFTVTLDVESLKRGWSELSLPFRGVAVESVELSNPRAILATKPGANGAQDYSVILPEPGRTQVKLQLSVRVAQEPGKRSLAFSIPATAMSRVELMIPEEDVRVDIQPTSAVKQTRPVDKSTQVVAFLGNATDVALSWMPPAGKTAEGGAVVFAEEQVRAHVGERILKVSTTVFYQVLRGETDTLRVRTPEGMRLISVKGDNIREWKEEGGIVMVRLHSALKAAAYTLALSFERILAETPTTLSVPLPRVEDVLRESGHVVLGHESSLTVRIAKTQGLSQADREEVPEALRDGLGVGFRYLAPPVGLDLEIEKILPQIRSFTTSVITLGREEDAWVGWIDYSVAKAGVFRLEIRVPGRWTVASIGDPGMVEDFQTSDAGAARTITVSLKTKGLGAFRLPFKLTAPGSAATGETGHSPPVVVASSEDRGLFGIASPKAFDLTTVSREKTLAADVDELFRSGILPQIAAGSSLPLAYSYREQPASVKVKLEAKKTEIDMLSQHLVEISDGGVRLTHLLDFEVLYAAVDRITFTAPAALDTILKIEAKDKKEVRKISTDQGRTTWEIVLQAPIVGSVSVTVTHETNLKALEPGKRFSYDVPILHSRDAREKGFVAVRKEGTLEISPDFSGLETIDMSDLPDKLRRGQIYGAFRYFAPDPRLTLGLTRYEYQPLATAIVNLLKLESVLSEERVLRTRATFIVQNTERQYLELSLPAERILSLSVAGRAQQPRKRQGASGTLVQIPTGAGAGAGFPVVVVHEEPLAQSGMTTYGSTELKAPQVLEGVPVSKVELDLYVPPGFVYFGWSGSLRERLFEGATIWTQLQNRIQRSIGIAQVRAAPQGFTPQGTQAPQQPSGIDIELPTRGSLLYRFDGMSPQATLSFHYAGRTAFRLVELGVFLAALAAGCIVARQARRPFFWLMVAFILVPLCISWLTTRPLADLSTSVLASGLLLFVGLSTLELLRRARQWRLSRLKLAPDPFLEDANPKKEGS